jgi:hypothetical protein
MTPTKRNQIRTLKGFKGWKKVLAASGFRDIMMAWLVLHKYESEESHE